MGKTKEIVKRTEESMKLKGPLVYALYLGLVAAQECRENARYADNDSATARWDATIQQIERELNIEVKKWDNIEWQN